MISARELRMFRLLIEHRIRSANRTHKASSAESIFRYCLRRGAMTYAWKKGILTDQQHLDLLELIREYGRSWFRHDAEQFAKHHLKVERVLGDDSRAPDDISRALGGALAGHLSRFFGRAKGFVRELITAGAMALAGPEPLDGEDLAEIERHVEVQHRYLDRFHGEIRQRGEPAPSPAAPEGVVVARPPMSVPQFVARAEQYGDSVYGAGQEVMRVRAIRSGLFDQERRVHGGEDEPCETCEGQLRLNWQPIGTLLPIGASECRCITTPRSRVLTRRGWVAIQDVRIGDEVFTHRLRWRRVIDTPIHLAGRGRSSSYLVGASGSRIGCTTDHRWFTEDGWRELKDIGSPELPVYNISHEDDMRSLWEAGQEPCQGAALSAVCSHLSPVREAEGSSFGTLHLVRVQRQGEAPVAGETCDHSPGDRCCRRGEASDVGLSRGGEFPQQGSRWEDVRDFLAGQSEALRLSIPVAVDQGEWPDPEGLGDPSQGSRLHERRPGEPGTDSRVRPSETAFQGSAGEYPAMDMSGLSQGIFDATAGQGRQAVLFESVLLPPGTPLYDLTVAEDRSFIIEGLVSHNCHCHCSFRYRKGNDGREYIMPRHGEPIPTLVPMAEYLG